MKAAIKFALSTRGIIMQGLTQGPNYGIGIIRKVIDLTDGEVKMARSTVYPALAALEMEGYIEWSHDELPEGDRSRGARPRRYVKLTAKGHQRVRENRLLIAKMFGLAEVDA